MKVSEVLVAPSESGFLTAAIISCVGFGSHRTPVADDVAVLAMDVPPSAR